jgi:tetratricopeptide (TPR) repeat protein
MHTLRGVACAFGLAALAASAQARAAAPAVDGEYESPLGRIRVVGDGATFRGVLLEPSELCPFRAGDEVLRATLLDDSLAGQVRVCLAGKSCRAREEWASAVLLAAGGRLAGAVHVAAKGCRGPLGRNGGVAFVRLGTSTTSSTEKGARARARALIRDGAARLHEGRFEAARGRFLDAIDVDPAVPEAYNGVGVTYRMRNDLPRALEWYKRALAVDPDFGDAYYNMACVYALEGRRELALRYLQIAALNGYATADGIDGDPDLEALRGEPGYRALVRARM